MTKEQDQYITFGNTVESRHSALKHMADNVSSYGGLNTSSYGNNRFFTNVLPNTTVRSDYNRSDYDYFRPSEALPTRTLDKIAASLKAYENFGIIRNVIDLMGDFASQGIRIVHPNKKIQKFLNSWFKVVNGKERSNQFLNLLYRSGNVVVRRLEGKISLKVSREMAKAANGIPNLEPQKQPKRQIPLRYVLLSPMAVELIGGDLASFCDKKVYALKLSGISTLIKSQPYVSQDVINSLINDLPPEIQKAVKTGQKYLVFNDNEVDVYHYKKDDWAAWATPMTAPILKDLYMLDKLKLADNTALDGVISSVRLWKLGVLDGPINSILPTKTALDKLRNELSNNSAGGVFDLVWGPELSFQESSSNSFQFLGEEKYKPTLEAIYTGLGIPQSLVGSGGKGFTNNYMSLKTLVERLEYGREILTNFWDKELKIIQKAMGHKEPGVVIFDEMVLSDEAAQQTLLLQMVDRNILSDETVRDRIKVNNEIEEIRVRREAKDKEGGKLPPKAGQFHNPQVQEELGKISLQSGDVTPSEMGVNLKPRRNGEKTRMEQQMDMHKQKMTEIKRRGSTLNGRPKNSKDGTTRKKKKVLPKAKAYETASLNMWVNNEYKNVTEIVSKAVLEGLNKKNLRMLTTSEFKGLEQAKFLVFSHLEAFEEVNEEKVYSVLEQHDKTKAEIYVLFQDLVKQFITINQREPNTEESRSLQISSYIINYKQKEEDKDGED